MSESIRDKRVSSVDQNTGRQLEDVEVYKAYEEKAGAKMRTGQH